MTQILSKKKWTTAEIRHNLETNNAWLIRGLMAIYARQTADEKDVGLTKHDNGIGFNGVDSNFLSNMVKFYNDRSFLTANQIAKVRKAMLKYSGQLKKIANGEV